MKPAAPGGWRGSAVDPALFTIGAVACAASMLPVLGNDLIWDDEFLINSARGLGDPGHLWAMLTRPFWHNSSSVAAILHDYWRPVTTFALWLGAFVWGTWAPGFHLISLVGALAAAGTLYLLARRLVDDSQRWVARWMALVFLAHPLSAEVICLTANVSDHLCFALLTGSVLLFHCELTGGGARWRLPLASLCVLLACGAKELGVVAAGAPAAAWLLRRACDPQLPKRLLLRPQVWASAVLPVAAYLVLRQLVTAAAGHAETHLPGPGYYAWSAFLGLGQALRQILVPIPGGAYTYIDGSSPIAIAVGAIGWIAAIGLLVWSSVRTRAWKLPAVGALLALALLLPSLLSADRFEDAVRFPTRYFHLPLAGALIAALPYAARVRTRLLRPAFPLLIGLLALLSWMRVDEWRDNVSFFHSETVYHPDSPPDMLNLVRAMTHARGWDEAEQVLDRIDELPGAQNPEFRAKLLNDRATIKLERDRDVEGASTLMREALILDPTNLANVLDLAAMRARAGRADQSVAILEDALEMPWFRDFRRASIESRIAGYRKLAAFQARMRTSEEVNP